MSTNVIALLVLIFFHGLNSLGFEHRIACSKGQIYFIDQHNYLSCLSENDPFLKTVSSSHQFSAISERNNHLLLLDVENNVWFMVMGGEPRKIDGLTMIAGIQASCSKFILWDFEGKIWYYIPATCAQAESIICQDHLPRASVVSASATQTLILDKDGVVWGMTNNRLLIGPLDFILKQVTDLPVIQIKAGAECSSLIDKEHNVWFFGRRSNGIKSTTYERTLTLVPDLQVKAVAIGREIQAFLALDGTLVVWGTMQVDKNMSRHFSTPERVEGLTGTSVMITPEDEILVGEQDGSVIKYQPPSLIEEAVRGLKASHLKAAKK